MASFLRRAMVQLGLVDDDEYDDYEVYDEPHSMPAPSPRSRSMDSEATVSAQVRPLPRDRDFESGGVTLQQTRPAVVRPVPVQSTRVHVVQPSGFADAQEIGERLKTSQPVIVNLQDVDADLSRRLIDFCSGAVFVAGAKMQKVAKQVFLLTPSNVEVSDEEKRRLQERGLYAAAD
ncbi:MAG TPA: cell division protein SepF [Acidimicrobiales bacterium]|jgi:cell division inhibitor SepF